MGDYGKATNPLGLYALLGASDQPYNAKQTVESDYGLAFTRELSSHATPLGSRILVRATAGAFAAVSSGLRIRTTRPFGIWVDDVWVDFDTNFSFAIVPTITANLVAVPGVTPFSYDYDSLPVTGPADITIESGTAAAPAANLAFVLANGGLASRVGGRFWLPPNVYLEWTRTTVNTAWSGNVSLSYQPNA